jgi:hypothetical protein
MQHSYERYIIARLPNAMQLNKAVGTLTNTLLLAEIAIVLQ